QLPTVSEVTDRERPEHVQMTPQAGSAKDSAGETRQPQIGLQEAAPGRILTQGEGDRVAVPLEAAVQIAERHEDERVQIALVVGHDEHRVLTRDVLLPPHLHLVGQTWSQVE